jgi:ribA/ribD-fused uncharacterized protein
VTRRFEAEPVWVEVVRKLAGHGVSDPALLVFILTQVDVRLPSGRFEMGGGYPRALATVAAALGTETASVQDAYVENAARRSDAAKLIAAALGAIPTIRALLPEAEVGDRLMFRSEPGEVVEFVRYLVRNGAASLPPPRASLEWKQLIGPLHVAGADAETVVVLTRFRRVTLSSGGVAEPLEEDDALVTVAEAYGTSYEALRDASAAKFKAATLSRGPNYARAALELERELQGLPGVERVERVSDAGGVVAKRTPEGSLPEAPWEAFPEEPTSLRWRMGPGEDVMGSWQGYWTALDPEDRGVYLEEKKPPEAWRGWIKRWMEPPTREPQRKIHFYEVNKPFGFMSNFARAAIILDDRRWPTSEHYFQAQKFAGRPEEEQIRNARTAMEAARSGRSLPGLRADWDAVKDDVMLTALRAKFSQHPYLRSQLLETGDAILVEHTANDAYWADGGDGSGRNRLGELLMQVRTELAR